MKVSVFLSVVASSTLAICNPIVPNPIGGPICTTTLTQSHSLLDLSPTTTVYKTTVTQASEIDCHGCDLLAVTTARFFGIGPERVITATITKHATTIQQPVCSPTPACKYCNGPGPRPMETLTG